MVLNKNQKVIVGLLSEGATLSRKSCSLQFNFYFKALNESLELPIRIDLRDVNDLLSKKILGNKDDELSVIYFLTHEYTRLI